MPCCRAGSFDRPLEVTLRINHRNPSTRVFQTARSTIAEKKSASICGFFSARGFDMKHLSFLAISATMKVIKSSFYRRTQWIRIIGRAGAKSM